MSRRNMADNKQGNADRSLPKPPPQQQNDGLSSLQLQETRPAVGVGRSTGNVGPDEKEGFSGMMKELVDNEDQVSKWLVHGNMDCKSLAKVLPVTTQDLIVGKCTADNVFETLRGIYIELMLRDRMACQLSKRTIPENWCRNDKQKQWWAKAQIEFQGDLLKRRNFLPLCHELGDDLKMFYTERAVEMHTALQETCKNWEQRVDQALFHGKTSPTFLFLCPTNKLSPSDFVQLILEAHNGSFDSKKLQKEHDYSQSRLLRMRNAVDGVAIGTLYTFTSCWECRGTEASNYFDRCSRCNVARYCCRDCQVRAWKSGHKNTCAVWKKAYKGIVKSQKEVDRIHAMESANIEGLSLNIIVDYTIASGTFFSNWDFHVITTDDGIHLGVPRGPSMKHFYENLGRMLRREWWIYPTTVSLEEYNSKAQDHDMPDELFFSEFLCFVLAHDIVGFVEESSKETGIEADVLLALVLKNSPVVWPEKHEMPVERFIELYNGHGAFFDLSSCDANRYRSDMKSIAIQVLREKWPK